MTRSSRGDRFGHRERLERVVADERPERQRSVLALLDEEALPGQLRERGSRATKPDGLAELGCESLEQGQLADEVANGVRMAREHLLGEVGQERGARLVDTGEHRAPGLSRRRLQRLDCQAHRRRPPTGDAVDLRNELLGLGAELLVDEHSYLVDGERELAAVDLQELPLPAQALDLERWRSPSGDDQVEARRRMPAERFDEARRWTRGGELMGVVDHEDEVGRELLVEDLGELGGERVGAQELLGLGAAGAFRKPAHVAGDIRDPEAERVAEPAAEGGEVQVVLVGCVPGARSQLPPGRQQRGFAESRLSDDHREPAAARGGDQLLERLALDEADRGASRQDLRNRRRVHDWPSVDERVRSG